MTLYVGKEYYLNSYKGKLADDEIEEYLEKSQEKIDSITFNRIVRIGFNNLTEFQQEKIKKAMCLQADYIKINGYNNEDNSDISSYSVLDISVNVDNSESKSEAELENMDEYAYDLIKKTGLSSRNWRFNG